MRFKYCFQCSTRNRSLREEVDPISLDNMAARPHHRRREKKLMTTEVNKRFPLSQYNNWTAATAGEGLSTNGGIPATAAPNRTTSVRDTDAISQSSLGDDKSKAALLTGLERGKRSKRSR